VFPARCPQQRFLHDLFRRVQVARQPNGEPQRGRQVLAHQPVQRRPVVGRPVIGRTHRKRSFGAVMG
jgi:hypothetical protein